MRAIKWQHCDLLRDEAECVSNMTPYCLISRSLTHIFLLALLNKYGLKKKLELIKNYSNFTELLSQLFNTLSLTLSPEYKFESFTSTNNLKLFTWRKELFKRKATVDWSKPIILLVFYCLTYIWAEYKNTLFFIRTIV